MGEGIYKTLEEVPFKIEAIDLCINPIDGLKYLREAKEKPWNKKCFNTTWELEVKLLAITVTKII